MAFFMKLADILSKLSYGNIKLARSITERDALMDALRESEAQLRTIVNNLAEGLMVFNLDGSLFQWNNAAAEMHGFTNEKAGPRSLTEFTDIFELTTLDGNILSSNQWPLHRILQGEQLRNYEVRIRRIDSDWYRVFNYGGTIIRDTDGQPLLAVLTLTDVTERFKFDKQREDLYQREHHIAYVLQEAILPQDVPSEKFGYNIAVKYLPALKEAEIGGDFFDVFDLGDGRFGVVIGDVVGKGLPAAMRVASARHSIRSYAYLDPRPGRVLALANDSLCKDGGGECQLLTVFYAVVDSGMGGIMYSSAGHEPPILMHSDGNYEELSAGGMPLGIFPDISYDQASRKLNTGDVLVMVTDGITEARTFAHNLFGRHRIVEFVSNNRNAPLDVIASGLLDAATEHAGGQLQDDVAIVVLAPMN